MECCTEVPVLIDELGGETHDYVRSWVLVAIAVVIIDCTISVAVNIQTLDRFAVFIINLLEKAMKVFPMTPNGKVCMDIGASTGGFTDCMLQNGATKVYAVDVGYGQLAWSLRSDERVVNMERTNIRHVTPDMLADQIEFFSVDVSFISLKHIFPVADAICVPGANGVCLVKPQFEAGREKVGKKGVVRESSTHIEVIRNAIGFALQNHFSVRGLDYSPIKGPEGNIEFLIHVVHDGEQQSPSEEDIQSVVNAAHQSLNGE